MSSQAKALTVALVAALALTGVVTAAKSPLTITSPKGSVSKSKTPDLTVAGTVKLSSSQPAPSTTTFYLRRDDCGGDADNPHLSTTFVADELGDGCGFLVGAVGVGAELAELSVDFPATDGVPATVDATKTIDGTLALDDFTIEKEGVGAGEVTVELTLTAQTSTGSTTVGSDSEDVTVTPPAAEYAVPFHITPAAALDKQSISGLNLNVYIHGPYAMSGFIGTGGRSSFVLGTYGGAAVQSVEVSMDDATFADPVAATIDSSGKTTKWTVTVPTPDIGKHVVYARTPVGSDYAQASKKFSVKK